MKEESNLIREIVNGYREWQLHKGNKTVWEIYRTIQNLYKSDELKPLIIKVNPNKQQHLHLTITLPNGSPFSKFKGYEELFAEAIGGSVFIERVGKAVYLTAYEQSLEGTYEYTKYLDPSKLQGKLMPLHFGFSAVGEVIHDLADLEGILIGGNRGTGKSALIVALVTILLMYSDAVIGIIDYKRVDTEHFRPWVAYAATEEEGRRMVAALNKLLTYRIGYYTQHKCNKLQKMRAKGFDEKPIVIVADELSEITDEDTLTGLNRLLRVGRAFGFYMIGATQRPSSTNVKNNWGDSKALLPTRVCFSVPDQVNSKIILDNEKGAAIPLEAKGRCIFQYNRSIETQTLFLEPEESEQLLEKANITTNGVVIYEQSPKRLPSKQGYHANH